MLKINKLNLKQKIILINIVILIPIIIFIFIITYNTLNKNLLENSVNYLLDKSKTTEVYITNLLATNDNPDKEYVIKDTAPFIATTLSEKFNLRVQLISNSAQVIYDSSNNDLSLFNQDINKALKGENSYIIKKIDDIPYIFLSSPIFYEGKQCGILRLILKNTEICNILNNVSIILSLTGFIALLVAIFLINTFATELVNPLIFLKEKSKNISDGNFNEKLNIKSGDEVEDLANTFNTMSENLENYITELKDAKTHQKVFFDNISHEFKTPLTAIIGFSEIIPKFNDKEKISHCSSIIEKEGKRLLNLVEEILLISKHNKNNFQIESTYINIKDLLDRCLDLLKIRLQKYNIEVKKEYHLFFTYGDYNKTTQVFINILDNAIKYSGCETITITSIKYTNKVDIIIKDDGTGFNIENNNNKGNGFGLNICKNIMLNQNGYFKLQSKLDIGTSVTITFFNKES